MIKEGQGEDWVVENGRDQYGNITLLKPLMNIDVKDNYDVPTQFLLVPIRSIPFREDWI